MRHETKRISKLPPTMVGTKIAVNILLLVSFPAVPAVETNGI
jgi:hypothetical protein